jgi:AbrB family looped-hinge helix DNA binding protein
MERPFRTKIGSDGRVMIPAELRRNLQLIPGETVVIDSDQDGIHLRTMNMAIERAQRLVAKYIPPSTDLIAELRADRNAEVAREKDSE